MSDDFVVYDTVMTTAEAQAWVEWMLFEGMTAAERTALLVKLLTRALKA